MNKTIDPIDQLNRSGFPFQLAVEEVIRKTCKKHDWLTVSREHPWRTDDDSGFIDLILQQQQFGTFRLVIECKRVKPDKAQPQWVFLLPTSTPKDQSRISCFEIEYNLRETDKGISTEDDRIWDDVNMSIKSSESEFCILYNDEAQSPTILEKLALRALNSAEGLGEEEISIARSRQSRHERLFIFAAIVTNATLVTCTFDPQQISIEDGTLSKSEAKTTEVPFVRFRKSLTDQFPSGSFHTLTAANKAREQSIFVVNSNHLEHFLSNWSVTPGSGYEYAVQRLARR